jgi:hypothetical protein
LNTTQVYTHVARIYVNNTKSPLDQIAQEVIVTERPNPASEERFKTGHPGWRAEYL